uniref:Costars family protein n=1 Tax=Leersia perrieri TaxID=77586 RepID=A0A0D9VXN1_9ORYZ
MQEREVTIVSVMQRLGNLARRLHQSHPFISDRTTHAPLKPLQLLSSSISPCSRFFPRTHPPKNIKELADRSGERVRRTGVGAMNVEEEVGKLKEEIQRLGQKQPDGSYKVTFGVLFNDDRCANIFEALVGTLRAAKKRKILTYDGELLLQGVHDNVEIILLPPPAVAAA